MRLRDLFGLQTQLQIYQALILRTSTRPNSALGEQISSPQILFAYKGKQYSIEHLTGVGDNEVTSVLEDNTSKYDLTSCRRPEGFWFFPGLTPWKPTGEAIRRDYYRHQCQGLLEYFIEFEVFNLFKQRYPVDIKNYYHAELVQDAIRQKAQLQDRFYSAMLSSLDEKKSEAEMVEYVKKNFPMSRWSDRDWVESLNGRRGFKTYRPYYALNRRCFPWTVEREPVPWVEYYCYSKLIRYHIQAEIERDKPKYIQLLEDRFGVRNYFLIRKAQHTDKKQLLKLINLVTNKKGEIAKGGLKKINKTLQELNSPTRMELMFGDKRSIARFHKISEASINVKQFISLGETADRMESYLYIFQEEPAPSSTEYPSTPGNILYSTAKHALLRALVEDVRAAIKPAKGITLHSIDQIVDNTGGSLAFFDKMFGVKLPKVVLTPK